MSKHKKQSKHFAPARHQAPASKKPLPRDFYDGKKHFQQGNYAQALHFWLRVKYSSPEFEQAVAEAYFRHGLANVHAKTDVALNAFKVAANRMPNNVLYRYHLGLQYHRENDLLHAIEAYQATLQIDPEFRRVLPQLVLALHENGQTAEAEALYPQLTESERAPFLRQGTDPLTTAMHLVEKSDWQAAYLAFTQVSEDETQSPLARGIAHYYLGVIAQGQGNTLLAVEHWDTALHLGFRNGQIHDNLLSGKLTLLEQAFVEGDFAKVFAFGRDLVAIYPENTRVQELMGAVALHLGYAEAEKGDWEEALIYWGTPISSGPSARHLAVNRAIAYEKSEQWDFAADAWREFVKRRTPKEGTEGYLTAEQVATLWKRISFLYVRAGELEEAVTTLQTALKHDPNDPDMGLGLATVYAEAERFDAAQNQINRVLKQHPDFLPALVFRAELAEVTDMSFFGDPKTLGYWHEVLAKGDEIYTPIAKERLIDLYAGQMMQYAEHPAGKSAYDILQEALKFFPDEPFLRICYIDTLISTKAKANEIQEQIALLDLTDEETVFELVITWHGYNRSKEAKETLAQANAQKPLTSDFYLVLGHALIENNQPQIAKEYFATAITQAPTTSERHEIQVQVAQSYFIIDELKESEALLKKVLSENEDHAEAYVGMASLALQKGNIAIAKQHLTKAEKLAHAQNNQDVLKTVNALRQSIESPSMLPPLPAMPNIDLGTLPPDIRRMMKQLGIKNPMELIEMMSMMGDINFDDMEFEDDDDSFPPLPPSPKSRKGRKK